MMEIWPAGPPKLIKPSLSQYQNACARETGSGVKSETDDELFLFAASISSLLVGNPKI